MRGLGGLVPGIWMKLGGVPRAALHGQSEQGIDVGNVPAQSWMTLAQPGVWIAAAAGVAMLSAAVRLRQLARRRLIVRHCIRANY